jgi:hypothetical protein
MKTGGFHPDARPPILPRDTTPVPRRAQDDVAVAEPAPA